MNNSTKYLRHLSEDVTIHILKKLYNNYLVGDFVIEFAVINDVLDSAKLSARVTRDDKSACMLIVDPLNILRNIEDKI